LHLASFVRRVFATPARGPSFAGHFLDARRGADREFTVRAPRRRIGAYRPARRRPRPRGPPRGKFVRAGTKYVPGPRKASEGRPAGCARGARGGSWCRRGAPGPWRLREAALKVSMLICTHFSNCTAILAHSASLTAELDGAGTPVCEATQRARFPRPSELLEAPKHT